MDIKTMNLILNDIVCVINTYLDNESEEKLNAYSLKVKDHFEKLEQDQNLDDFYLLMQKEFEKDPELYILLLSVIYDIQKDEKSIDEICRVLCTSEIDLFSSLNIRTQIESAFFCNPRLKTTYLARRKIHQTLLNRLENILNININPVPLKERNKKKIIIVTNQLIGELHGPTRIVKEVCYTLQKKFGYEVLLIVAVEEMNEQRMIDLWYKPIRINYFEEYNNNFLIECQDEKIHGYQIIMNEQNLEKTKALLYGIASLKPYFTWYIGGLTLFADLMRKFTTVVAMPCTDGYAISEAQIMMNYMNSGTIDNKIAEAYFAESRQDILHMDLEYTYKKANKVYTRSEFGIPDNVFVITIVGNRLDSEISEEFVKVLNRMLDISKDIVLVFIGKYNQFDVEFKKAYNEKRAYYIGFQNDLIEVLSLMNLFVNPERKGGGGGALCALRVGVPVITLDFCDIANAVGKDFICNNMDEMIQLVKKYYFDKDFYIEQGKLGIAITKNEFNLTDSIQTVISEFEKLFNK